MYENLIPKIVFSTKTNVILQLKTNRYFTYENTTAQSQH